MSKSGLLGSWVKRFLLDHLIEERNLSRNTQRSYRDTLALLLPFASAQKKTPVDRLDIFDLSSDVLRRFLDHVEQERRCSIRTRNQRLAAVHAMARFIAERSPEHIAWCSQIRAVPFKRFTATNSPIWTSLRWTQCSPLPIAAPSKAGAIMRSCCSFTTPALASPKQRRCGSAISTSFPTTSATYNSEARAARYAGARSGRQPSTRCSPSYATALPTNLSSSTGSAMQSHVTVSTGCFATMSAPHRLHVHPCFAGPSARTPSGTQPPRICCALASISTPSAPGSDTSPSTRPTSTPKSICNAKQKSSPTPTPSVQHPPPTSDGKTTHLCNAKQKSSPTPAAPTTADIRI